jgi:hypothetical protein
MQRRDAVSLTLSRRTMAFSGLEKTDGHLVGAAEPEPATLSLQAINLLEINNLAGLSMLVNSCDMLFVYIGCGVSDIRFVKVTNNARHKWHSFGDSATRG